MPISSETKLLVDNIERHAGRKFQFRQEIELIVDLSESRGRAQLFQDIIFYAKFITSAETILRRTGDQGDETARLGQEFRDALEKITTMLRTLLINEPEEVKHLFVDRFLTLAQPSLQSLLLLLRELSWVKNYLIDGERST